MSAEPTESVQPAIAERRDLRPALTVALGVAGYLALAQLVTLLISTLTEIVVAPDLYLIGSQWAGFVFGVIAYIAPIGLGVFLWLHFVMPLTAILPIRSVLVRAALAAVAGAVVATLVGLVFGFFGAVAGGSSLFGNVFTIQGFDGGLFPSAALNAVTGTLGTLLEIAPLVVLSAVLTWLWMRRRGVVADA